MRGIAFNPLSAREFFFERFYNNIQNLRLWHDFSALDQTIYNLKLLPNMSQKMFPELMLSEVSTVSKRIFSCLAVKGLTPLGVSVTWLLLL